MADLIRFWYPDSCPFRRMSFGTLVCPSSSCRFLHIRPNVCLAGSILAVHWDWDSRVVLHAQYLVAPGCRFARPAFRGYDDGPYGCSAPVFVQTGGGGAAAN